MSLNYVIRISPLILVLSFISPSDAQNRQTGNENGANAPGKNDRNADRASSSEPEDRAALEQKFKNTLTKSVFNGRWCMVAEGQLGEERSEKYSIQSANKIGNDLWLIYARVEYGNKDILVPVPVSVKWAGDTPVISITNLGIPGLGTYTARVVIYENQYAGTWSGSGHGGHLHGLIVRGE